MEALIVVVALISLGLLAMRFGADSRPSIQSDEYRLAMRGMVWDDTSRPAPVTGPRPTATIAGEPAVAQVVWRPTLAAPVEGATSPFPILAMIDLAKGTDRPAFATDPNAALLERHARDVIDQSWSDLFWFTGLVDQARFSSLCDRLEQERESLRQVNVVVLEDGIAGSRGAIAHAKEA